MNNWTDRAIEALSRSLGALPVELNELDWKVALSDKSERLAQHLSAFANYPGGGYLAFGIADDGRPVPIATADAEAIVQRLGQIARNSLAQPLALEHATIEYNSHPLLLVCIPEHPDKPVHLRGMDMFNSYTRSAGQTVRLTRHEVKSLIARSMGLHFEGAVATAGASGDEVLRLLDFAPYFSLQSAPLPETKVGILEKLATDEFIRKAGAQWDILNLGAILFAKDLKKDFAGLRRKAVRVIVYKGNSRIDALKEQEGGRGYAAGFEGLVNYVMDQLPTNEVIESALRRQVKMYPEIAIREFVANALIHQDFAVTGAGVQIEIFADRVEITNPGVPLVDVNRFIDSAPRSRNETLASLMRRLNICEERGSGIDRAIQAIETFQLPAPRFIRGDDYTRVIVYAPAPLTRMNVEDRIRACYQHTCLHYCNNQPVNNQSIRQRFNINKNNVSSASKILSDAIQAGLIKASDPDNVSKKFASYVPYWA